MTDQSIRIVLTTQGIAAVGTVSPALAAQAWRDHLTRQVPEDEHEEQRLDELAWLSAVRRWIAYNPRMATVWLSEQSAPWGAEEGLVLLGRFDGRRRYDA